MNGLMLFDRNELVGVQTETPDYRILHYHIWLGNEQDNYFLIQQRFVMKIPRNRKSRLLVEVEHWKDVWEGTLGQLEELKFLLTLFRMDTTLRS